MRSRTTSRFRALHQRRRGASEVALGLALGVEHGRRRGRRLARMEPVARRRLVVAHAGGAGRALVVRLELRVVDRPAGVRHPSRGSKSIGSNRFQRPDHTVVVPPNARTRESVGDRQARGPHLVERIRLRRPGLAAYSRMQTRALRHELAGQGQPGRARSDHAHVGLQARVHRQSSGREDHEQPTQSSTRPRAGQGPRLAMLGRNMLREPSAFMIGSRVRQFLEQMSDRKPAGLVAAVRLRRRVRLPVASPPDVGVRALLSGQRPHLATLLIGKAIIDDLGARGRQPARLTELSRLRPRLPASRGPPRRPPAAPPARGRRARQEPLREQGGRPPGARSARCGRSRTTSRRPSGAGASTEPPRRVPAQPGRRPRHAAHLLQYLGREPDGAAPLLHGQVRGPSSDPVGQLERVMQAIGPSRRAACSRGRSSTRASRTCASSRRRASPGGRSTGAIPRRRVVQGAQGQGGGLPRVPLADDIDYLNARIAEQLSPFYTDYLRKM